MNWLSEFERVQEALTIGYNRGYLHSDLPGESRSLVAFWGDILPLISALERLDGGEEIAAEIRDTARKWIFSEGVEITGTVDPDET